MSRATVFRKLEALYRDMQAAYDEVSGAMGHTCDGCARNCCVSHFQPPPPGPGAFSGPGPTARPRPDRAAVAPPAPTAVSQARAALAQGLEPRVMCPVNVDGRCSMYRHRLMICRLHGIPNVVRSPRGGTQTFPGCWLSQEITARIGGQIPHLDRTPFYVRLAAQEREFLGAKTGKLPKVDATLSELIVAGEPRP